MIFVSSSPPPNPCVPDDIYVEVGLDAGRSLFLPSGTLVIYVGRKQYDDGSATGEPEYWDTIDVLVDGVIGWVYFHELELADETRRPCDHQVQSEGIPTVIDLRDPPKIKITGRGTRLSG